MKLMSKVVNIVGSSSNVGKTYLLEGLIKELKFRGYSIATIKHDVHGFDIDKKGKDTYKHRKAGSETVIISSKNRLAMIKELKEETELNDIIKMVLDKDIILVEGYKNSNLRKIEVFRSGVSNKIITPIEKIIAVASDIDIEDYNLTVVNKEDYKRLADLIEKEKEFKFENYQ
jgi:molybdopterin-guanine dinucleotide biosynthesis protein B